MSRPARSRRHSGIRVRTTVAAALVVGVALAIGSGVLVLVLRSSLAGQARTTAAVRADRIVGLLEAGATPQGLVLADEEDWLAQVVDAQGRVVAATPRLRGAPAFAQLAPGESATAARLPASDGCPCLIVASATPDGRYRVLVAQTLDPVTEGTTTLAWALAIGVPLLVGLVALTTWRVVGRTLAPVESIRGRVAEISDRDLDQRVPQPAGTDEVARLAATMNQMLDRLQAAQDRQRRFVTDASHELRNPIAAMRHELEMLIAEPEPADVRRAAEDLLADNVRLQHLVEDLLQLARADEGRLVQVREQVDVDDLVLAEARRLRAAASVTVDASGIGAGRVVGDPNQLGRMVRNLLDNAQRHAASRVSVGVSQQGGLVVVDVGNDGPAIAPEDRALVFQRFARLDGARARDDGGSGLGLAIVAETAAAHGGSVRVDESGGHTHFVVSLPAETDRPT